MIIKAILIGAAIVGAIAILVIIVLKQALTRSWEDDEGCIDLYGVGNDDDRNDDRAGARPRVPDRGASE